MACSCAARCLLILFNVIFMIAGIALAIGGGIFAWNSTVISNIVDTHLTIDERETIMGILEVLKPLGLGFFITGVVILSLCLLGLIGACMNSRCILAIYLILHGALLIGELIVVIIFAARPDLIYDQLKLRMEKGTMNYVAFDSPDVDSKVMTLLMTLLSCCGTNNGRDFDTSTKFQRNREYNGTSIVLDYPIPCCKLNPDKTPSGTCPTTFTSTNSNIDRGCWTVFKQSIDIYAHVILYVSIGVMVLQLFLLISAGCLVFAQND